MTAWETNNVALLVHKHRPREAGGLHGGLWTACPPRLANPAADPALLGCMEVQIGAGAATYFKVTLCREGQGVRGGASVTRSKVAGEQVFWELQGVK